MADEKEVKASQEETVTAEEQQIAEQVNNDAAKTPVEAQGQPEEETPSTTLTPEKIAEMTAKAAADASKEALNSFQGRFANHTASQQKELQDMIDKRLEPVLKFTESVERAQVEQLDPEQQVEYYKNKLEEKQQDPAPQVQEQPKMSPQQEVLADTTRQMIQESGLNILETDEKVWKGWNQNMSTAQLIRLAQKNIDELSTPKQPEQAATQEPAPQTQTPPSMSSAPKAGSNRVTTISDLSQMMASGQIDATQYRAARNELKNKGYASL